MFWKRVNNVLESTYFFLELETLRKIKSKIRKKGKIVRKLSKYSIYNSNSGCKMTTEKENYPARGAKRRKNGVRVGLTGSNTSI